MDDRVIVHKILVSSETTTNIVQTLTPVDMSPTILSAVPFILKADIDINHDGYKDLFLVTSGSSSQIGGNYWIFNPKKKQFVYSGNYPELIMENTRNDIAAVVNSGYDLQYKEFYEFINGQMMKIKTIERKNISPTEDMLTTKIRVLNSWKITSQIKVPAGRW